MENEKATSNDHTKEDDDENPMKTETNISPEISPTEKRNNKEEEDNQLNLKVEPTSNTLARIPESDRNRAIGNVTINESTKQSKGATTTRDELILKIEQLENQKKALRQKQLIKEIQSLQSEVQTNVQEDLKTNSFGTNDVPNVSNSVAPMATDISARSKIDMQLQELNEKIEQTSKYVEERKKAEDLSSLNTEELHTKVQELKHRKELLSKFRQKAQVISLIQDLHTQVSAMKENVKTIEDKIIPSDRLKVYALSPSEIDVYWDPADYTDLKAYTLHYRKQTDENTVFHVVHPDASLTSFVIEDLKPGTTYDVKLEGLANEGYRITTECSQITTFRPVNGFALIIANHSNFQLSHLTNLDGIQTDIFSFKEQLESFGFEVLIEENITGLEIIQAVEKYSSRLEQQEIDCFLCVVTGYMYNGNVYGTDGKPVLLNKVFEPLRVADKKEQDKCEIGEGKVKLVFVDAFKVREQVIEELDDSLQPRAVQFRSTSKTVLEASWKRPKLTKRKLKDFKLLLHNTFTSQIKHVPFNQQNDSYSCKFDKLNSNTEYNLEISADFEDGYSGKPVKATLTTFQPQFMQPRKLSVEAVSSSQIYVYWIPPKPESRSVLGYKVSIRDQTHEEYSQKMTTYTCIVFNDLKEGTEYNISVTTIVEGKVIDIETEVRDEESMPVYIDITTLADRTPSMMSGSTVQYLLEEPDFFIASATATTAYKSSTSSFLNTLKRHLEEKYEKKDIQSIVEDVKKEVICSLDNYEIPQSVTTLRYPVFLGKV
ncbi:protein sidekick-1-like [Mytilus edulis]|uniref:protein sidekick-1-like n=1 Tax=Mytilus edulis TaxID=6550 RepID=UPI0039EE37D1